MRCEWITSQSPVAQRYKRGGGQCSRPSTYTDGIRCYCTQHAKVFATPLRKAENKIRDGLAKIPVDTHECFS